MNQSNRQEHASRKAIKVGKACFTLPNAGYFQGQDSCKCYIKHKFAKVDDLDFRSKLQDYYDLHYQPDPAYNCHYEQERDLVYSLCARVCEFPG